MLFINKSDSSRDLTIFMISSVSSFSIISAVVPDPKILLGMAACCDAADVNPNGVKTLLADSLNTFPIKGNPDSSNGPKGLPKNFLIVLFYAIEMF